MPLWSGSAKVVDRAGVISVQMRDHERIVRVDIKHEVLIGASQLGSQAALPAFEMNRELIERLASAKYDSSQYVAYANGAVISINGEDLQPVVSAFDRTARERNARIVDHGSPLLEDMRDDAPAGSANSRTPAAVD
jgi:Protein of unknown function (DUF1488)